MFLKGLLSITKKETVSNVSTKTAQTDNNMKDLLLSMLADYGLREVPGIHSNPKIIEFFDELGYDVDDDSFTAWCSAAIAYYAKENGYEYNKSLLARDWLKYGEVVLQPSPGDVVVFWRDKPDSWKGHVGLFISQDVHNIYTLGGNQNNSISISPYPQERLLGYRRLKKTNLCG